MADVPVLYSNSHSPLSDSVLPRAVELGVLGPFLSRQRWFAGQGAPYRRRAARGLVGQSGAGRASSSPSLEVAYTPTAAPTGISCRSPSSASLRRARSARAPSSRRSAAPRPASSWMPCPTTSRAAPCSTRCWGSAPSSCTNGTALPAAYSPSAPSPDDRIARSAAEQSNSCVLFGKQFVLKLLRHLEPGPNPELEISRVLSAGRFTAGAASLRHAGVSGRRARGDLARAACRNSSRTTARGWDRATADARHYLSGGDAASPGRRPAIRRVGRPARTPDRGAAPGAGRRARGSRLLAGAVHRRRCSRSRRSHAARRAPSVDHACRSAGRDCRRPRGFMPAPCCMHASG